MSELLLSIPEAAKVLDKSVTYVRDRIADKTFHAMPVGKRVKLAESAVNAHMQVLAEKEKDIALRRPKPKAQPVEQAEAAQVEMFSRTDELLGKLLTEQKATNVLLAKITGHVGNLHRIAIESSLNSETRS